MEFLTHITVSVVVVNWNRRKLLQACLRSLGYQRGVEFEVIVIDNGSTDGSKEMLAEAAFDFPMRVIANSANRGFCAANNQGIAAAKGEFIALLNNDAEAEPGWLKALQSALQSRPDFGMAASKILVWEDPRKIDKAGHLIYPDGQNRGRGSGQFDHGQFETEEEVLWPDGCAALYRRSMLTEIGGFDEDLFAYGDDAELGLRARIAGWRCVYVPRAVVRHHRASSLGLLSSRRLILIERNRVLLAWKHFPMNLLWLNGVYFVMRIGAGVWAAVRGRGEVGRFPGVTGKFRAAMCILQGNIEALAMLPKTLRKRKNLKPLRRLNPSEVRRLILEHRISLRELMEQAI